MTESITLQTGAMLAYKSYLALFCTRQNNYRSIRLQRMFTAHCDKNIKDWYRRLCNKSPASTTANTTEAGQQSVTTETALSTVYRRSRWCKSSEITADNSNTCTTSFQWSLYHYKHYWICQHISKHVGALKTTALVFKSLKDS